ncbi:hypothetical protein SDRG_15874 [Saprolegnia diclina VS20]|uniref:Uncharacterized protein n=1 Tax=Saprolegnia diclina (strain VS20) TaxID=1156394 RepID=T0R9U1_SAPDV|nr:hypothetical protein SDRG_15874 [Saprolegnia diclina VS20]EQC26287.1 hypothetical protein SDRG_15874 [Saprolegnia diclina VS20]|eukprot:XP_008620282.1 hypothetical protein SDRG_15874 [Saprolegnia diclina VS20]
MLATTTTIEVPLSYASSSSLLSPASAIYAKKTIMNTTTFAGSNASHGRCKYKSGRCMNERTIKENGEPHTLCEEHRLLHNKNQRKSDTKRRRLRRALRNEPHIATMVSPVRSASMDDSDDALSSILCSSPDDDDESVWWSQLPSIAPITWTSLPEPWTQEELHILSVLLDLPLDHRFNAV